MTKQEIIDLYVKLVKEENPTVANIEIEKEILELRLDQHDLAAIGQVRSRLNQTSDEKILLVEAVKEFVKSTEPSVKGYN